MTFATRIALILGELSDNPFTATYRKQASHTAMLFRTVTEVIFNKSCGGFLRGRTDKVAFHLPGVVGII